MLMTVAKETSSGASRGVFTAKHVTTTTTGSSATTRMKTTKTINYIFLIHYNIYDIDAPRALAHARAARAATPSPNATSSSVISYGLGHFMIGPGHTTRTTTSISSSVAPMCANASRTDRGRRRGVVPSAPSSSSPRRAPHPCVDDDDAMDADAVRARAPHIARASAIARRAARIAIAPRRRANECGSNGGVNASFLVDDVSAATMGLLPRSAESIARANTIINERNAKRDGSMRVDARGTPVNSFGRRLEFTPGGIAVVTNDGGVVGAFDSGHGKNPSHIKWPDLASESETGSREESEKDLSGYRETTNGRATPTKKTATVTGQDGRSSATKKKIKAKQSKKPLETTIEYVPTSSDDDMAGPSAFERLPSRGAGQAISVYDDDDDESSSEEDKGHTKVVVVSKMQPKKSSLKAKGTVKVHVATGSARQRSLNKHDEFTQPPQEEGCAMCCVIS